MSAYYNDTDPFCAQWLRNLIAAGAIPAGTVDERSIADIDPADLRGFRQCHFFAGIGGWAYALQLAGWPPDRPVWTGSCPCQPFSSAGRQGGALDERHLWPWWFRLIGECRPHTILGEQVEGAVGFGWIDRVSADLEAEGYAIGAAVLGAHSIGAPHIRQRLFWVADRGMAHSGGLDLAASGLERGRAVVAAEPGGAEHRGASGDEGADGRQPDGDHLAAGDGAVGWVADADEAGSDRQRRAGLSPNGDAPLGHDADRRGTTEWLADADGGVAHPEAAGSEGRLRGGPDTGRQDLHRHAGRDGAAGGLADAERDGGRTDLARRRPQGRIADFWSGAVWLECLDGKARRVEPQIQPLATGIPNRVGLLRGSGNAITPQTAAVFVTAVMECIP